MFKDLQDGFSVHILDKTDGLKYYCGTVAHKGTPRFESPMNSSVPMDMSKMPSYNKVIDLTVEYGGKSQTFVVPETSNLAGSSTTTLACSPDLITSELNATIKSSTAIIESVDHHKALIDQCKEALKIVDKSYAKDIESNERIEKLEKAMEKLTKLLEKKIEF